MQEALIEYLKGKYKPAAILLHGSRARGRERENSDWDFIFLYNSSNQGHNGREVYENQNLEFSSHALPIEDIEDEFSSKLQSAKVLYEEGSVGTELLDKANDFYQQGVHWTNEKTENHKLWVQGRIDGMRDNTDNPILFTKYFSDFYPRVFNYWYWIRQHSHSQPVYVAVVEIAEKDSEYYELVNCFANTDVSMIEKVEIAEKLRDRLFQ